MRSIKSPSNPTDSAFTRQFYNQPASFYQSAKMYTKRLLLSLFSHALLSSHASARTCKPSCDNSVEVDAIIVGGGFSGLAAAYKLHQAGLTPLVLEASERVGGKSRTQKLKSGPGLIELGATWINNITQPKVFELSESFGLDAIIQYVEGVSVTQYLDGSVHKSSPNFLPAGGSRLLKRSFGDFKWEDIDLENFDWTKLDLSELDIDINNINIANLIKADELSDEALNIAILLIIEITAQKTNITRWDDYPKNKDVTLDVWVDQIGLRKYPHVRGVVGALSRILVGRDPHETGAQFFFDYIKSGRGLRSLGTEDYLGAQYQMIKQGTSAIATSMAGALKKGSVRLSMPVTQIRQSHNGVVVTISNGCTFSAKKAILAIMPSQYKNLKFKPDLPSDKKKIVAASKPGVYAKMIVTYSEPWWRSAGLVGKFESHIGPICYSWEISVPEFEQYSLAFFVAGDIAKIWLNLPSKEAKEQSIVEHLAQLVGEPLADKARDTLEINFVEWTKEQYLEGGPTDVFTPGALRKYGNSLRKPFKNIHFAGTELAFEWKGYLEGAVTSGQRAADEIIEALQK